MGTTKILGAIFLEAVRSLKRVGKRRQRMLKMKRICTLMRTRKLLLMNSMAWTAIQRDMQRMDPMLR